MSNDTFDEYRRLIMANFVRMDADAKEIRKDFEAYKDANNAAAHKSQTAFNKEIQSLRNAIKDQNWKMILVALLGGVGGSEGIDMIKFIIGNFF